MKIKIDKNYQKCSHDKLRTQIFFQTVNRARLIVSNNYFTTTNPQVQVTARNSYNQLQLLLFFYLARKTTRKSTAFYYLHNWPGLYSHFLILTILFF